MKNGFTYHGAENHTMAALRTHPEFGAVGKQIDNLRFTAPWKGLHDGGFRNFSVSNVRASTRCRLQERRKRIPCQYGRGRHNSVRLRRCRLNCCNNIMARPNTTPQTSTNRVGYVNLTGKVEATPSWTIEGSAHVRVFDHKTLDGNPTERSHAPTRRCFALATTSRRHLPERVQLANPFGNCRAGRERSNHDPFDHDGRVVAGDNTDQNCSVTTIIWWSEPASTPASAASPPARNWVR